MAIYHLSTKPVSRSSGRTATASIAYRAGIAIKDERTGKEHDYTKRSGVAHTRLHTPNGLKIERNELWNLAETTETRKNSRTAREIVVNLPHELSGRLRIMLVNDFAKDLANQYGVAVDVAIHTPDAQGDNRNHHAHIMLTTRKLERLESGRVALTSKSQLEMSNTQLKERGLPSAREELKAIREQWANITNKHLKEAKIDARIDHRSHKDRGLEQVPTKKLGWEASSLERKGIKTATGDYNRMVEEYNHTMKQLAIIEKSLKADTEQREQSNDRTRERLETAIKDIERATDASAWADRRTKLVNQVVGECQRELEGAEREINASASAIDQADRRIAEHQQSKLKAEREAQLQQQAKELLLQHSQELHAQAVKGEKAIDVYDTRLADIENQFEQLSLKSLKKELAELQQAYDTAKKPMMTSQSKWSKQQLEKRMVLRSLERQISVKEFQDSGKYKQHAKDWIAKNEPQTVQEAQQGQQAIKEYKEQQQKQEPKVEPLQVRTSKNKNKGMER
ncbi:MobQ family relaxase [Psychrobacter urativorans]|uniref:MobQ family relaxase n=1 Tax=Psychrobacter urativorans TaxID=45610 RepID=UPI001917FBA9|nr:MobQ family relaxase [Psychrobacter urativorans]